MLLRRVDNLIAKNGRQASQQQQQKEKFGILIPRTVKEALEMDKKAGNNLWKEAIDEKMNNLY